MPDKTGYDPGILRPFDGYVHGTLSRRELLDAELAWRRTVENFKEHL